MSKYVIQEGKMMKVDEADVISLGIESLSSKKFKSINIFVKDDNSFINFKIIDSPKIKISKNDIQIGNDQFNLEIDPKTIKKYDEDSNVIIIETKALKIALKKY